MTRRRLTDAKRLAVFLAAGGVCHLCGGKISGKGWDVEHVIPLAMGGADDETNMRPAHRLCHKPKTAADAGNLAKAKRLELKNTGAYRSSRPMQGSKASGVRKRMNGTVEWR